MNILFFLTPKDEVAYIYNDYSVRQALEKMQHYGYTAIPMIDRQGTYLGTVTEGDFLKLLTKRTDLSLKDVEQLSVKDMKRHVAHTACTISSNIEDLFSIAMNQNFIPVTDDDHTFIGIVTRKDILQYFYSMSAQNNKK